MLSDSESGLTVAASLAALHLESQAPVAHVYNPRWGIADVDGQSADDRLALPAPRRPEPGPGRHQLLRHEIQQACGRDRLEDVISAAAARIGLEHRVGKSRDDDCRNRLWAADDELQPVEGAQPDIGDQQVGRSRPEDARGIFEGPDGDCLVAGFLQEFGEAFPRCLVVVDDQNLRRHALLSGRVGG